MALKEYNIGAPDTVCPGYPKSIALTLRMCKPLLSWDGACNCSRTHCHSFKSILVRAFLPALPCAGTCADRRLV
eukprot:188019-Pleurochrysis_carterae.AAC.1